jgi:hypothetical protein
MSYLRLIYDGFIFLVQLQKEKCILYKVDKKLKPPQATCDRHCALISAFRLTFLERLPSSRKFPVAVVTVTKGVQEA